MPLVNRLDFVQHGLSVAYRASPDPQELYVDVIAEGPPRAGPMAHWCIEAVIDTINAGGAGGAIFSPGYGFAALRSGPTTPAEASGERYVWMLTVRGVAPLFMRNIVEEMRRAGMDRPIRAMAIAGSLPLNDSAASVTEAQVRAWIADPTAYLEAWPQPGFPVSLAEADPGALVRVELAGPISPPLRLELERISVLWINAVRNYPSRLGGDVSMIDVGKVLPVFAQTRKEFRARYQEHQFLREPSQALMVNLLQRFHEQVAPIASVEIRS